MAEQDKPSGIMNGLVKNFLGVPDSRVLGTGDKTLVQSARQTELARRQVVELQELGTGQKQAHLDASLQIQESQRSREAIAGLSPHLRGIHLSNIAVREQLEDLERSLTDGLESVSGAVNDSGKNIVGIPTDRKDVDQLIADGVVDESELTILAARRWLNDEQTRKLIDSLPAWKIKIIQSGLVTRPDMKEEKKLTSTEKVYLAELRSKASIPVEQFRSLNVVGRHRLLDSEVHHALAEDIRELRNGTEGGAISLRKIDEGTETLVRQGQTGLTQQRIGLAQDDIRNRLLRAGVFHAEQLVRVGEESLTHDRLQTGLQTELVRSGHETAASSREVAINTRESAQTLRTLAGTSQRTLGETTLIREHAAATNRHTAIIAGYAEKADRQRGSIVEHTRVAALFAERADTHLANITSLTADNAASNALTARYAQRAELDRSEQIKLAQAMVEIDLKSLSLLGDIDLSVNELVGINSHQLSEMVELNERMGIGNEISMAQLGVLEDIRGGVSMVSSQVAMVYNQLVGVNEGLELLSQIGIAQIEGLRRVESAVISSGTHVANVIEAVRLSILEVEERAIDRDRNRDKIRADESFRSAMEMLQIMDIDEAIKHFDRAQDRYPGDYRVFLQRGFCYVCKEIPGKAEKDFKDALKRINKEGKERIRAVVRLNLARLYYAEYKTLTENGETSEAKEKLLDAIEESRRAVDEDPKYLESKFALATYLAAFQLLEDAFKLLLEIIPQNPDFVVKVKMFSEFEPLTDALHNTLSQEYKSDDKNDKAKACISIIKDSLEAGDIETAQKSIGLIIIDNPGYLIETNFWESPEYQILSPKIVDNLKNLIKSPIEITNWGPDDWYAIATIGISIEGISRGEVVKAFLRGAKKDPSFESKNVKAIKSKLMEISGEKSKALFLTLKLSEALKCQWLTDNL